MYALEVTNICKSFQHVQAVDHISLTIEPGRIFGLIGPNGAGKTTTMRMIMHILLPDSGEIRLFGERFHDGLKSQLGYLPEERGLYPRMKLIDHLQFLGEMKGLSSSVARQRSREWLARFELLDRANKKIEELSKGLQQKAQFIGTILHNPKLLIVDEPFSGLDPVNTKLLKDILLELQQKGVAIILSTHLMDQAERLCQDICLINKGKAVLQGQLQEIKKSYSKNRVMIRYHGDGSAVKGLPQVAEVNDYGNSMEIRLRPQASPEDFFRVLADLPLSISKFEAGDISLNQIFIDLVDGETTDQEELDTLPE